MEKLQCSRVSPGGRVLVEVPDYGPWFQLEDQGAWWDFFIQSRMDYLSENMNKGIQWDSSHFKLNNSLVVKVNDSQQYSNQQYIM